MKSARTVSVDDYLTGVLQRVMYRNVEGKLLIWIFQVWGAAGNDEYEVCDAENSEYQIK